MGSGHYSEFIEWRMEGKTMKKILLAIVVLLAIMITPVYAEDNDFEISDDEWALALEYLEENRAMLEGMAKDLSVGLDDPITFHEFSREDAVYFRQYWNVVSTVNTNRLCDLKFDTPLSIMVGLGDHASIVLGRAKDGYEYGYMSSGDMKEFFQRREVEKTVYDACGEEHPVIWLIKFWQIHGTAAVAECGNQEIIVPIGSEWKKFYNIDQKWYSSEDFIRVIKEVADPNPGGYGGGEGEQQGPEIQKARLMAPWIAGGICVLAAAVLVFAKKKKGLE